MWFRGIREKASKYEKYQYETNRCQAVWGTWVFTGSQGRNSTHCVIAPRTGTHHLSTSEWTCTENRYIRHTTHYKAKNHFSFFTPLFKEEGLPVFMSASGIPTVFWPSFPCAACFRFLPRLLSWWAVRASATLPSAVANNTFFKLGVSFSWENMDWKQIGSDISCQSSIKRNIDVTFYRVCIWYKKLLV